MNMSLALSESFETSTEQYLLYPLETIPVLEHEPFSNIEFSPEACLPIMGLWSKGARSDFTHVVRMIAQTSNVLKPSENEPHRGRDKLVFFNFDVHGKFHWQAIYSSALFLSDEYRIIIP